MLKLEKVEVGKYDARTAQPDALKCVRPQAHDGADESGGRLIRSEAQIEESDVIGH